MKASRITLDRSERGEPIIRHRLGCLKFWSRFNWGPVSLRITNYQFWERKSLIALRDLELAEQLFCFPEHSVGKQQVPPCLIVFAPELYRILRQSQLLASYDMPSCRLSVFVRVLLLHHCVPWCFNPLISIVNLGGHLSELTQNGEPATA